jgi:Kef-type K+ transport system membrane component KefB
MTTSILISLCILVLIAYLFDLSASKTKIPSVILLLILGFVVKVISNAGNLNIPDLSPVLPLLGIIGLILIVLDYH